MFYNTFTWPALTAASASYNYCYVTLITNNHNIQGVCHILHHGPSLRDWCGSFAFLASDDTPSTIKQSASFP